MSETIGGKYTAQEPIRHSQVGIWHAVESAAGKRQSALLIGADRLPTPESAQRLAQSIASVGGLRLPGLVNISERFVDDRGVWLISTTTPAPTLAQALNVGISLTAAAATLIATDTGQTLSRLHQSNLAHGEVSARTIVLTTAGAALLAETGYAHAIAGTPAGPGSDVMDWVRLLRQLVGLISDETVQGILNQAADQAEAIGGSAGVNTGITVIATNAERIAGFGDRTGLVSMASAVPLGPAAQQAAAAAGPLIPTQPSTSTSSGIRGRASVSGSYPVVTPAAASAAAQPPVAQPPVAQPPVAQPPVAQPVPAQTGAPLPLPLPPQPSAGEAFIATEFAPEASAAPVPTAPQPPAYPAPQPPTYQTPTPQPPAYQPPAPQPPIPQQPPVAQPPVTAAPDLATRMGSRASQEQAAASAPPPPQGDVVMRFGQGPPPPTWESAIRAQTSQQPVVRRKSPAKKWIMGGLTAGLLVVACAIGAYLVATRFLIAGEPMAIESVTVAPAKDPSNKCDITVDVVATLVTNGRPGTVTFEWVQVSNGETQSTGVLTRELGDEKVQQLHLNWQFGGKGTARASATLKILEPTVTETKTEFTYTCK